jgi:hypothetical protein
VLPEWMKIMRVKFVALGIFMLRMMSAHTSWSAEIKFDGKNYADQMGLSVGISGTMKGEGVIYKNNTYAIWCIKDRRECLVSSIEQIGDNLMGRLDYPYSVPIIRWNDYEVAAATEVNTWTCVRTTITIMRNSQTATWVEERVNAGKGTCSNDKWVHRWSIE